MGAVGGIGPIGWQPGSDPQVGGRRGVRSAPAGRHAALAALPFGRDSRVTEIGPKDGKFPEPSGIVFHEERGTLFAVGDRGHVLEMTLDGDVIEKRRLGPYDLEGITIGPEGRVFAAQESPPRIYELDPDSLKVTREFKVKKKFAGARVIARDDNEGLEGLAYHAKEGAFFALNQGRPPSIVRLDVPLQDEDGGKAKIKEVLDLGDFVETGASDLTIDPATGHFLVTEAGKKSGRGLLHEITREGELVRTVSMPGRLPEGLTLTPDGTAFIAQDKGRFLRIDPS